MSGLSAFDDAAGLERVTASLRRLPPVDAAAVDRVVAESLRRRRARGARRTWFARAAALVLAAGVGAGGVLSYRAVVHHTPAATPATASANTAPAARAAPLGDASFAANGVDRVEPAVAVPFALRRPGARRVALVGDFDDWSPTAIPMTRDAAGTWTATVALTPGRHAYAFVVDDSTWVTDPRAEVVRDADYGRAQSILLVGRP